MFKSITFSKLILLYAYNKNMSLNTYQLNWILYYLQGYFLVNLNKPLIDGTFQKSNHSGFRLNELFIEFPYGFNEIILTKQDLIKLNENVEINKMSSILIEELNLIQEQLDLIIEYVYKTPTYKITNKIFEENKYLEYYENEQMIPNSIIKKTFVFKIG